MNKKYIKLALINVLILIPSIFTIFAVGIPNKPTSWSYPYGKNINSVSISSNGTYVVFGSRGGEIILIDQVQREVLWRFQSGNEDFCVDISADGYYIAACGRNGEVYLFNKSSNMPIWSYTTGIEMAYIAISRDGTYIISADYDGPGKLFLFNSTSSTPVWIYTSPFTDPERGFSSVAISDNGSYIFASLLSGNASLFNNVIGTPLWIYDPYPDDVWMNSPKVAISPDGSYIAMQGGGRVVSFNKTSPIPYWVYSDIKTEFAHQEQTICITSDGSKIYSVGDGIYIFNTTAMSNPLIKYIQFVQISSIGISLDGQYFTTKSVGVINIYTGFTKKWEKDLQAESPVVMSDDGRFVATGNIGELFFINRNFPEFIEDYYMRLIIGIIILAGSLAFEAIMIRPVSKYLKRSKSEKLKQQQENFEKLMTVSSRIRIGMLKNVLKISNKDLNEKIERWQRDFDVIVEGEYLIFNEENLPEILDLLDEQYEEWTKKHEKV